VFAPNSIYDFRDPDNQNTQNVQEAVHFAIDGLTFCDDETENSRVKSVIVQVVNEAVKACRFDKCMEYIYKSLYDILSVTY
jgi:hypothetical protein